MNKGYVSYSTRVVKNVFHNIIFSVNSVEYNYEDKSNNNILIIKINLEKGQHIIDYIKVINNKIHILPSLTNTNISINNIFDNIYLLNLDRDIDKYNISKKLLSDFNIKFQRFQAVDGNNLVDLDNMNKYAYGCLLSHIKIVEDAIQNNYNKILIFEDDIMIHKDFINLFGIIYSKLLDWDMLYLGCSQRPNTWYKVDIQDNYYKSYQCNGTFAYAIDSKIYKNILNYYKTKKSYADTLLHNIQNEFNCYTIIPNLVIADVSVSNIRGDRIVDTYSEKMGWNITNYKR